MNFNASSVLLVFLCTLLVFAALADAISPRGGASGRGGGPGGGGSGHGDQDRDGGGGPRAGPAPAAAIPIPKPATPKPIDIPPNNPKPIDIPPNNPKPVDVPHNDPKPGELPKPPEDHELGVDGFDDAASVFSLGSFKGKGDNGDEQKLFRNFDERSGPYFSKMIDFFAVEPSYIDFAVDAYAHATGKENPYRKDGPRPTGQRLTFRSEMKDPAVPTVRTITATFNPQDHKDVCRAWTSLATYCSDAGTRCACYSGTYYVPDQWNSLAAGCASMTTTCRGSASTADAWCQIGKTASQYTNYCSQSSSQFKFAQIANINTPQAQSATPTPHATQTTYSSVKSPTSNSYYHSFNPPPPQFTGKDTSMASRSMDYIANTRYLFIGVSVSLMSLFI